MSRYFKSILMWTSVSRNGLQLVKYNFNLFWFRPSNEPRKIGSCYCIFRNIAKYSRTVEKDRERIICDMSPVGPVSSVFSTLNNSPLIDHTWSIDWHAVAMSPWRETHITSNKRHGCQSVSNSRPFELQTAAVPFALTAPRLRLSNYVIIVMFHILYKSALSLQGR